ncbi:MAG: F0F1 ATP synthase subunit alpha [Candidatus Shapirobacteria bacterium]
MDEKIILEIINKSQKPEKLGEVVRLGDGAITLSGVKNAGYNQFVEVLSETGELIKVLILEITENLCKGMVLGQFEKIAVGDVVVTKPESLSILVDNNILGKLVGPMAEGQKGELVMLESIAAGVSERQDVSRSLFTGITAIDALIPIGKGQRELIIGDRKTGKTAIAVDTIINQKGKNVTCVYVAIGQKATQIATVRQKLIDADAMDFTVIVEASASKSAAELYIAPFTGCAIAEYFAIKGQDVLIVYDDLTRHANAYREISLLLGRSPGREAYPGNIFYLHSRLLERALQYNADNKGGSITALPIIETQAGDVSAYIPTNVISITDGQIYLDNDMFNSGQKPAINVGSSVSRVGGSAQIKAIKQVAGSLKLDLAQFRELQAFAQFGSDLDSATLASLEKGAVIQNLLNQKEGETISVTSQVIMIYAAINSLLPKDVDINQWRRNLNEENIEDIVAKIENGAKVEDKLETEIKNVIAKVNQWQT